MIYQDFEDQQLLELIYRYDSQMSLADQEYLLQVENREHVVRTLHAKILEREQLNAEADEFYDSEEPQAYYAEQDNSVERETLGLCHKNLQM